MGMDWLDHFTISLGPVTFSPTTAKGRREAELRTKIRLMLDDYRKNINTRKECNDTANRLAASRNQGKLNHAGEIELMRLENELDRLGRQAERLQDQLDDALRDLRALQA